MIYYGTKRNGSQTLRYAPEVLLYLINVIARLKSKLNLNTPLDSQRILKKCEIDCADMNSDIGFHSFKWLLDVRISLWVATQLTRPLNVQCVPADLWQCWQQGTGWKTAQQVQHAQPPRLRCCPPGFAPIAAPQIPAPANEQSKPYIMCMLHIIAEI